MKRLGLVLVILSILIGCQSEKGNEFKISASFEGVENGNKVFLKKIGANNQPEDIDTTEVNNGKFAFSGVSEAPELHYIFVEGVRGSIGVVLESGNIKVKGYKDSISASKVSGTISNDEFGKFLDGSREINKKINEIRNEFRQAASENDTITANTLREVYTEAVEEARNFEPTFVEENPSSYISLLILERMFFTKVKTAEETQTLMANFSEEVKNTKAGKNITQALEDAVRAEKTLSVGKIAPDFTAPTPDGRMAQLDKIKGKVTIIDFWASWCKPCRVENPRVVALYNKYHEKGLTILGVSLDRRMEDWMNAVQQDGLPWLQVSSLKHWQEPVAKLYNVNEIPATYILDENRRIVAKNLRGPELEAKIAELLN
ncbi:redoxin domain-containing protein [Leptobacterium flavescens]|uniref:Redoxin domain-containing protein n=1 Tax=Leptobacterium flavescens TaxID=472055 RepID=A0A6P0UKB7_9FLAO|nr:TlpA disulfide reductase family protein [Leptobacterium flavescens]NER13407.1 redoxin domain-containing protein [Leptobacterium flavescens]